MMLRQAQQPDKLSNRTSSATGQAQQPDKLSNHRRAVPELVEGKGYTMTTAYTYILQCANGQYYVGSTIDLNRRIQEHQAGLGAKFTRSHLPVKLVYYEEYPSISQAFCRERQLHGWSRAKKEALIKGDFESLPSLCSGKPSNK